MTVITVCVGIMPTNAYIAVDEATKKAVVVDPGGNAARIFEAARGIGAEIEYIFLTHGHFDHILAVDELRSMTGAKIAIHQNDAPLMKKSEVVKFHSRLESVYREAAPDILVRDGDIFRIGETDFRWMHTPGHTEGSCVILADGVMFSGDTLFRGDCGRCDLEGGDYGKMLASLKKLHDMDGDWRVMPGHGEETTLAAERLNNFSMLEAVR